MHNEAHSLSPRIWSVIYKYINKQSARTEFMFAKVVKRDESNKLVWVREFGNTPIPLVGFKTGFRYYDTQSDGTVIVRDDQAGVNANVVVPKKNTLVVIVKPYGNFEKPICIGEVFSTGYWEDK